MAYQVSFTVSKPGQTTALLAICISALVALTYYKVLNGTEAAIVFATFFGPVFAVWLQASRDADRADHHRQEVKHEAVRDRQMIVFSEMLSRRGNPLDPIYVQAFNLVPLEFRQCPPVLDAWRDLLAHLNGGVPNFDYLHDLRTRLLREMGQVLNYTFTAQELKNESYSTRYAADQGQMKDEILSTLHALLKTGILPVTVIDRNKDALHQDIKPRSRTDDPANIELGDK